MADITMCNGDDCPLKSTCYRYNAKPTPYWQAYFSSQYDHSMQTCEYYWDDV